MGAIVGIIARKLLKFSKRRELIDRESMVSVADLRMRRLADFSIR